MTIQKRIGVITVFMVLGGVVHAQVAKVRSYTEARRVELTDRFRDFLSIPNVAADPSGLKQNADFLLGALWERGVEARLLTMPGAPPVVYGEILTPGAEHTIVLYAHYDGQPVTPAEWEKPPFKPEVKTVNGEPRIYARGAGDDKAAIFAQLTALDAMKAAGIRPRANIRFVWEGEEEAGSPHLEQILEANPDAVHGDVWLICDGPVDQSGKQTVVFGARGDAHVEITLYGPHHGLHSGHYGNWAPNPAMMTASCHSSERRPAHSSQSRRMVRCHSDKMTLSSSSGNPVKNRGRNPSGRPTPSPSPFFRLRAPTQI